MIRTLRPFERSSRASASPGIPLLTALWLAVLLCGAGSVHAQETPDSRAFKAAAAAFQDGVFELAERRFAQFVAAFPESPMLPEAILLQARASLEQTNLAPAIALLKASLGKAGPLADQYRYRMAEAYFLNRDYPAAAQTFAALTSESTNSALLLEAGHGEALARFRLRDFPRVIALLGPTNGAFQTAARVRPTDRLAVRGNLLLAEALLEQREFRRAEEVVLRLEGKDLTPEFKWDRQYLLSRILTTDQRPVEALAATTNLVKMAVETTRPVLIADSVELQGQLLEQLNLLQAALVAYTNNLGETVPAEHRRLAALHIIEIQLSQDRITEAARMIEDFLAKYPADAASDVALLTVGELQLKLHRAAPSSEGTNGVPAAGTTNHLQQAFAQFGKLLATQTNSPLRGRAFLGQGWCLWLDGKLAESAASFKAATELLPPSHSLAQARFKLGDAQFSQGDLAGALASYRAVTNDFAGMPRVRDGLFEHALFQMVRVSLEMRDLSAADGTMRDLLDWFPKSPLADRALLLVGQAHLDAGEALTARERFLELLRRSPGSELRPEAELAIARSLAEAGDWKSAIAKYGEWITSHPTNELRAAAEFNLARSHWRSGDETNAFSFYANFVAAFPTNELAPRAQYWVGEYYMRQADWENAQRSFQRILDSTNWPVTSLTYQARLAAGRAAFARQGWKEAIGEQGHFTALVNDVKNCPPDIAAQALFAFADTLTQENADPARSLIVRMNDAREVFRKILPLATNQFASRLVPLAWGRIGDCSLQLAGQDAKQYALATNAYLAAMTNALADIGTRSRAEYGLARALEAQANGGSSPEAAALRQAAFEHYYNIALGTNAGEREEPDPIWVKEAGFAAARLAEERRQWTVAINIYKRMQDVLPPLRQRLQEKIDRAGEQRLQEKN